MRGFHRTFLLDAYSSRVSVHYAKCSTHKHCRGSDGEAMPWVEVNLPPVQNVAVIVTVLFGEGHVSPH